MEAFLQFKSGPNGPFQTVAVPHKIAELSWQRAGLTYTATGYGRKIPSRHMVQYLGKWRRVYVTQISNAGSAWVLIDGEKISVDICS